MARAAALLALVPFLAIWMEIIPLIAGWTTFEASGARTQAIFFWTPYLLAAVGVSYLVAERITGRATSNIFHDCEDDAPAGCREPSPSPTPGSPSYYPEWQTAEARAATANRKKPRKTRQLGRARSARPGTTRSTLSNSLALTTLSMWRGLVQTIQSSVCTLQQQLATANETVARLTGKVASLEADKALAADALATEQREHSQTKAHLAASQADNTRNAASLAREQQQHSQTKARLSVLKAKNSRTAASLARKQQQHSQTKARLAAAEAAAADWEAKCASKELVSTAFSRILSGALDTANSAADQIAASFADAQARAASNSAQLASVRRQQAFFQDSEALLVQPQEVAAQRILNLLQIIAQLQACAAQGDWAVQLLVIMVNSLQQQLVEAGQREAALRVDNRQHISQLSEFRVKTRAVLREQHTSRAASNTALQVMSIFLHNHHQQQQQQQQQVAAADSAVSHSALQVMSILLHHQQQQKNATAADGAAAAAASRAGAQASTPAKQVQLHRPSSAADAAAVLCDQQQQQQVASPFRLLSVVIPPSSSSNSLSRTNSLTWSSSSSLTRSSSSGSSIASIGQLVISSPYQHAPSTAAAQAPHTVVNVQHLQQQLDAAAASDAVSIEVQEEEEVVEVADGSSSSGGSSSDGSSSSSRRSRRGMRAIRGSKQLAAAAAGKLHSLWSAGWFGA